MINNKFGGLAVAVGGAIVGLVSYELMHKVSGGISPQQEAEIEHQLDLAQHESDPSQALTHVPHVLPGSRHFAQVQNLRETLSRQIFDKAQDLYRRGEIDAAIALSRTIPFGSSVAQEAQVQRKLWLTDSTKLQSVRQALAQKNPQQAMNILESLRGSEVFNASPVQALFRQTVALSNPTITVAQNLQSLPLLPPPAVSVPKMVIPQSDPIPEIKSAIATTLRPTLGQTLPPPPAVAISSSIVPPPPVAVASYVPPKLLKQTPTLMTAVEGKTQIPNMRVPAQPSDVEIVSPPTLKVPDSNRLNPTPIPKSPTRSIVAMSTFPSADFSAALIRDVGQSLSQRVRVVDPERVTNAQRGASIESDPILSATSIQDMLNTTQSMLPNSN
jgi:hypothetical protein